MLETWLPHKLRTLRVSRGLTLVEAAKKTGVTRATLSELERGHRHPVAPTLVKIAKGYGVSVEELIGEPVGAGKVEAPEEEQPDSARFDLGRITQMDMTEFAQYAETLDDDTLQRLRGQIDVEAAQRHSTDFKSSQSLVIKSFVAGLDLQVRRQEATRAQLAAIVAAVA